MALLLNLDTATSYASVCLSRNSEVLAFAHNATQQEHAAFLHVAVQTLLAEAGVTLKDIDAVAVTSGPGSYTGLRVGMSAAKGFCYALKKPLICVNTLEVMAWAAIKTYNEVVSGEVVLFCPMIDARRMEVFTAVYDKSLNEVLAPCAMILEPGQLENFYNVNKVVFVGEGAKKFRPLAGGSNVSFEEVSHSASDLATLALQKFNNGTFTEVVYAQPTYYKEFYTTAKQQRTE